MCHRHFGISIYFDIFWLCQSDDPCQQPSVIQEYKWSNQKKTCETTAVPQASDWNPMIKIIENSVSGAICTVWWCILTAIARPQAPLSHPARARGWVFTAGLIPITLYRFVFADFLLLRFAQQILSPCLSPIPSQCPQRPEPLLSFGHGLEAPGDFKSRLAKKPWSHGAKQTGIEASKIGKMFCLMF